MSLNSEDEDLGLDLDDAAPAKPMWPEAEFELPLRKPLVLADATVTSLLLREPTGAEWELIMEHPVKTRRRFGISLISGVPMKACGAIGIGDLLRGEAYLNGFFEVGQTIDGS